MIYSARHVSFSIITLLISINSFSQGTDHTLVILDEISYEPVEFATIIFLGDSSGTYSNGKGVASFASTDSIFVRHISYINTIFIPSNQVDTLFLSRKQYNLEPVTVYSRSKKGFKKPRFAKNQKLRLSLQSYEIGKFIDLTEISLNDLIIPFEMKDQESVIKLKLYTIKNQLPDSLIFEETQNLQPKSKVQYLSFNSDFKSRVDTVFVSVELLNISGSLPKPSNALTLFLKEGITKPTTLHTFNFKINQIWFQFLGPDNDSDLELLDLIVLKKL